MAHDDEEQPFVLDFAFPLPPGMEIESEAQGNDCVTWGEYPTDDD